MLYRYAQSLGLDVGKRGGLSAFPDASGVSGYAADAMSWAVGAGLITGRSGALAPRGAATRAEVSATLRRLIEYYA
jgi:hypothetical protein